MPSFEFLPVWPPVPNGLFYVAIALAAATLIGELLFRLLRIPRIVGYALIGLLVGAGNLTTGVLRPGGALRIIVDIALALLLFELGCRVHFKWLRANPWLLLTSLIEAALTACAVFLVLHYFGYGDALAAAVACIATCTSPAVVLWVTTESNARGQITERLLMHTALNSIYALLATRILIAYLAQRVHGDLVNAVLPTVYLICGSFLLAMLLALGVRFLNRRFDLRNEQSALLLFAVLLVIISVATLARLSTLLVPLLAGILLRHLSDRPLLWPRHFGTAGGVMVVMLFVLTGISLDVETLQASGLIGLAVVGARLLAKVAGVVLLSYPSGVTAKQGLALGLALAPMSGLAFALSFEFRDAFSHLSASIDAIVFSAIAILALIGPLLTQQALRWVGEISESSHR